MIGVGSLAMLHNKLVSLVCYLVSAVAEWVLAVEADELIDVITWISVVKRV